MSEGHELIREALAAYVLGGLDPRETARVARHLQQCAQCRGIVREYRAVLEILPLALPPAQPSPSTRLALQARLHTDGRRRPRAKGPWRLWWPARPRTLPWGVIAVLLLIVTGVGFAGGWLRWSVPTQDLTVSFQQLRSRDDVRIVRLIGSTAAPSASGKLFMTPDLTEAGIAVRGLPPLPPDRSYQVWFYRPDRTWASGGVFRVDQQGNADVIVRLPGSLTAYNGCWITEEPGGGSPVPTGQEVLATAQP